MHRPAPLALKGIVASTLAVTVAYLSAFLPEGVPPWGPWLFLVGMGGSMVSTMALGAARGGGVPGLRGLFAFLFVLLVGGFGAALLLPASEGANSTLVLGLPLRAALVVYGIGLVPVILVPIFYARTFHALTLRPGELDQVREAAREARAEMALRDGRVTGDGRVPSAGRALEDEGPE
jgi:hypothetical protein